MTAMPEDIPAASTSRASQSYDALWERVDNQGRSLRALAEETATQFRDFRADTSKAISELASALKGLDGKLDANAKVSAEHQRPQYAALFIGMLTAIGVAVTIIQWQTGLHDKPVDDKLISLQAATVELTKSTANAFVELNKTHVSDTEFQKTVDFQNRISDLKSQVNDQQRSRMQVQLDKVENEEVSRREHEFHWSGEDKRFTALDAQITALSARLDAIAPASDVIKRLTDREHELELRVFGAKPMPPG